MVKLPILYFGVDYEMFSSFNLTKYGRDCCLIIHVFIVRNALQCFDISIPAILVLSSHVFQGNVAYRFF